MDSKKMSTKTITMCGLMAAVCCILGPLSIPIGPVPISLTVVAVFLCVYVLGMVKGTIAYIVYLLLGAV
jgi:biotin transport system substrate-specific component